MTGRRSHGVAVVACLVIASLLGGCAWLGFETADSVMKEGQQLFLDKKYDEAEKAFAAMIDAHKGTRAAFEAELQAGDVWMDAGNYDKAGTFYAAAAADATVAQADINSADIIAAFATVCEDGAGNAF